LGESGMKKEKAIYWLKFLLGFYIVSTILVAGLNYGLGGMLAEENADLINSIYLIFENEFKIAIIIIGSLLSLQIIKKKKYHRLQKVSIIAFSITALLIHGIIPWLVGNRELYYFFMPLPWSTTGLQLMNTSTVYFSEHVLSWGAGGVFAAVVFFLTSNIVVFIGTLIMGRRWQCSYLCMLNGFVSEIWSDAFPLIGKKKELNENWLKFFNIFRWIMFIVTMFFVIWWFFRLLGISLYGNRDLLNELEVIKYLSLELLMAMFFWVVWTGRGYCYYCPLGTFLSLISRLAGQRIKTDNTHCIQCNQCSKACPMSIDVASAAKEGKAVENLRCVGCGHCIDVCPTQTLSYETHFLSWWREQT